MGDDALTPYDEEVEWIQPETLGAYSATGFIPSQRPQSETKLHLDRQTYTNDWVSLFDAGVIWSGGVWVYANSEGKIGARRGGHADFGPFSISNELTVGVVPRTKNPKYYAISVDGKEYRSSNFNQKNLSMTPDTELSFWHDVDKGNGEYYGYSKYRLYWSKWWNADRSKLESHFIPVKKNGEYGLCDLASGTVCQCHRQERFAYLMM